MNERASGNKTNLNENFPGDESFEQSDNSIARELADKINLLSKNTKRKSVNKSMKTGRCTVKSNHRKKNSSSTYVAKDTNQVRKHTFQSNSNRSGADNEHETVEDIVDLTNANVQSDFPSYTVTRNSRSKNR